MVIHFSRPGDRIPVGGEIFRNRPDWHWGPPSLLYKGADKSLARPGRKQDKGTEDFDVHITYL
jgi:hypothetical protein